MRHVLLFAFPALRAKARTIPATPLRKICRIKPAALDRGVPDKMTIFAAMDRENVIDLLELELALRDGIGEMFPERLWVRAEISSISVKSNGHCYMELSQSGDGMTVAKARAVIWRSRYTMLERMFLRETGSPPAAGMTILARVQVSYSELYGMTLTIDDLDAEVTLGAAEKKRLETIARLKSEGMMERQRGLELPLLPYRLAVISAKDAAGYGDFCRHLDGNEYGFKFSVTLFEAQMQGLGAPESISDAIEVIQTSPEPYDAVLIMRGGGSVLDLACFDDYGLCLAIAQCPLPIFTAIGHDRDYHVADMVAFRFVKTPTALADEFLDCYISEDNRLTSYSNRLRLAFLSKISAMESRIEILQSRIMAADPRAILSRGYTLAADLQGRVLKSVEGVSKGDRIRLLFPDGSLELEVKNKNVSGNKDGRI